MIGSDGQKTRAASGRPPKHESRAAEFCRELITWKETPESMRPSLHALGDKLGTSHQTLSYHLNRLDRWLAEERAKQIRARAEAEGRPMTFRENLRALMLTKAFDMIEELRLAAKRGPLRAAQVEMLKLFAKQGFSRAKEILSTCRQMTPEEEKQARSSERAAGFAAAATKTIARIRKEAERGPLCRQDVERLKYFARRKHPGAKELLQKYQKSAEPRPEVPQ